MQGLKSDIDRMARRVARKPGSNGMDVRNIVGQSDRFSKHIDHPATFDAFLQLLGPLIQLSMTQTIARARPQINGQRPHRR